MMKKTLRNIFVATLLVCASAMSAQQVNTLYFLENAPMRHTINPAFQPVSKFYLTLPVIGYTSMWSGTNNWTMSDFLFKGPNGNTITPWHPDAPSNWMDGKADTFAFDTDLTTNLFGFGFRIKEKSYFHINVSERVLAETSIGHSIFKLNDLSNGGIDPFSIHSNSMAYTEFSAGFSHKINDQWAIGAKLKVLTGQAHIKLNLNDVKFNTSFDSLHVSAFGDLQIAAPLAWNTLPANASELAGFDYTLLYGDKLNALLNNPTPTAKDIFEGTKDIVKPAGMGGAIDLGFTYKPIEHLQITAAVTDLGFMRWHRSASTGIGYKASYKGIDLNYGDYATSGGFDSDALTTDVNNFFNGYADSIQFSDINRACPPYIHMTSANLNIGVDANFWKNRVGVGVYSRTRFYNNKISEEVTLGAAFRPTNWFNLAASYSFINGRWSNIGAAISIAPYDGLMLTVASDYVPTSYAKYQTENPGKAIPLPYKTSGVNVSVGLAIVVGTNKLRDKDKDGVPNRYDKCPDTPIGYKVDSLGCPIDEDKDGVCDSKDECPNTPSGCSVDTVGCPIDDDQDGVCDSMDECLDTPAGVEVDEKGCPFDTDGDGVYDYQDSCKNTPAEAIGYVDSLGCPLDSDNDGVYDYLDECLDTPAEVNGLVDENGCPLDTDGDGIYDYLDKCPDTPAEAVGHLDENGCPLDSDNDGIYDYLDKCPDTPAEAVGHLDENGCPLDSDNDGVYDYLDKCPDTPAEAVGHLDENGCPLDSDNDGVYDYLDKCPDTPAEAIAHIDSLGCVYDTDGDGIYDYEDECPDTPEEANGMVDPKGCPLDSDGDDVSDYVDECPNTPEDAKGLVDEKGCPVDSDGDAVADYVDQCPDTPEEVSGMVDENGCPTDSDGDGVADYLDKCPDTPAEAIPYVDADGCAYDTDGDGVYDLVDECPDTPEEAYNHIDSVGCPFDTDGDGVYDYIDKCPDTPGEAISHVDTNGCVPDTDGDEVFDFEDECPDLPGTKEEGGCPVIKRKIDKLFEEYKRGIQFEFDKDVIKGKHSFLILDSVAQLIIANPDYTVEIQGHCDSIGTDKYNLGLSERRAKSVYNYLVKKGVPKQRLTSKGYGEKCPIATNSTRKGRHQNRRVDFVLTYIVTTYETVYEHADNDHQPNIIEE